MEAAESKVAEDGIIRRKFLFLAPALFLQACKTTPEPLKSDPFYLFRYQFIHKGYEKRKQALLNGAKDNRTLDEIIIDHGFYTYKTNVPYISHADLVILGDLHGLSNLDAVVPVAKTHPNILVEASKEHWNKGLTLDLMLPDWLTTLQEDGRKIIPVDDKYYKDQHHFYGVQMVTLRMATHFLARGEPITPFEEWMIYDDLNLCSRGASRERVSAAVSTYVKKMPAQSEVYEKMELPRQREVVKNTVDTVKQGGKYTMVFGTKHIHGYPEASLIHALERERIRYVVFLPDIKRLEKIDASETKEHPNLTEANDHFVSLVLSYIPLRTEVGRPNFTGSIEGYSDRMRKVFLPNPQK